jgi:hypothetical protein
VPVAVVGHSEVQSYCWMGKVPEGARSGNIWPFA